MSEFKYVHEGWRRTHPAEVVRACVTCGAPVGSRCRTAAGYVAECPHAPRLSGSPSLVTVMHSHAGVRGWAHPGRFS